MDQSKEAIEKLFDSIVAAAEARGVPGGIVWRDDRGSGHDFLSIGVGRKDDAPRCFPLSIGIDMEESGTVGIAPLIPIKRLHVAGDWEVATIAGDLVDFVADWIAAAVFGRLVLVESPGLLTGRLLQRVGVSTMGEPHLGFNVPRRHDENARVIRTFEPLSLFSDGSPGIQRRS